MNRDSHRHSPARLKRGIYLLPNLFTTAALFAGFYAVIVALRGEFQAAAIAILVAMVLDGMDGRVARMTNTESDFGKEYDSLSDMIAFGLAPGLVFYQWGLATLPGDSVVWSRLGWIAAFFFTVTAALRLARFNSRAGSKSTPAKFFEGLPSPSAAGLVASSIWLATEFNISTPTALATGYAATIVTGSLMVSNFHYYSFKDFNLGERVRFSRLLMIPLIFILIALNPPLVLTCLFATYACSGPIYTLWRRSRRRERAASADSGVLRNLRAGDRDK